MPSVLRMLQAREKTAREEAARWPGLPCRPPRTGKRRAGVRPRCRGPDFACRVAKFGVQLRVGVSGPMLLGTEGGDELGACLGEPSRAGTVN
jgi:hypothetical protein